MFKLGTKVVSRSLGLAEGFSSEVGYLVIESKFGVGVWLLLISAPFLMLCFILSNLKRSFFVILSSI